MFTFVFLPVWVCERDAHTAQEVHVESVLRAVQDKYQPPQHWSDRQSEQAELPTLMWPRWWWWRAVTGAEEEERCALINSPSTWITMTSLQRSPDLCTANKHTEHKCVCVWGCFPSVFLHQYERSIQTGRERRTHTHRLRQQFSAYCTVHTGEDSINLCRAPDCN